MITDAQWALTLEINVTANFLLTDEAAKFFKAQGLDGSVVLTSSANAVVPKRGRSIRRKQGGVEPPGARAGGRVRAAGARQRHQPGDGGQGLDDVPARSCEGFAAQVQHPVRRIETDDDCATRWRGSTRSER